MTAEATPIETAGSSRADAPAPSGEKPPGLLAAVSDRLNPILVKEVRQALSGKLFRGLFVITAALAEILAISHMIDQGLDPDGLSGGRFFQLIYGCLSVAVHLFVPFLAFTSLGNEWDENTFDLLTLSDLRPRVIVFGKLFSGCVQAALYYSAFGPFLVFAFLMRGLDLRIVAFMMLATVVTCITLTSLALMLSSLSRAKYVRILLMTLLAGVLVQATVGSIAASSSLIFFSPDFNDPEIRTGIALFFTGALIFTALNLSIACARLAHAEENRTSALRILTLALVGFGLITGYRVMELAGAAEALNAFSAATLVGLAALSLFYVTEPERLGRRVERTVPKNRALAALTAPFLPSGGLGIVFFTLTAALVLVAARLIHAWHPLTKSSFSDSAEMHLMLLALAGYLFIYLGLPSALFSRWTQRAGVAIAARVSIPVLAFLGMLLPAFAGLLLDSEPLREGKHLGNPLHLLEQISDKEKDAYGPGLMTLGALVLVTFLLNVPRILRAVGAVCQASKARA